MSTVLPWAAEVMPDQREHAKCDGGNSEDVTAEMGGWPTIACRWQLWGCYFLELD